MTELTLKELAVVFRAASHGTMKRYRLGGYDHDEYVRAEEKADAFEAIAEVFEMLSNTTRKPPAPTDITGGH